jgi:hypothetical protein
LIEAGDSTRRDEPLARDAQALEYEQAPARGERLRRSAGSAWYLAPVAGNLADPDYEPTDEELKQLSRDAFADVPARLREAQRRLWDEIEAQRAQVLARLANRKPIKP